MTGSKTKKRLGVLGTLNRCALGVWIVFSLAPVYWLLHMSFQTRAGATASPPHWLWFVNPNFDSYRQALGGTDLLLNLVNSAMVAFGVVALATLAGGLAAYALVRFPTRRQHHYVFWVLTTRMAPPLAIALPLYSLYNKIGLTDTVLGLILAHTVMIVGLVTWMLMETFRSIPVALEDAARVDGCSRFRVFVSISMPLARTGLVGAAVLSFLLSWNDFFVASVLTSEQAVTGPVGLYNFLGYGADEVNQLAAGAVTLLIPGFLVVWIFQRQLVRGLSFGALKE